MEADGTNQTTDNNSEWVPGLRAEVLRSLAVDYARWMELMTTEELTTPWADAYEFLIRQQQNLSGEVVQVHDGMDESYRDQTTGRCIFSGTLMLRPKAKPKAKPRARATSEAGGEVRDEFLAQVDELLRMHERPRSSTSSGSAETGSVTRNEFVIAWMLVALHINLVEQRRESGQS